MTDLLGAMLNPMGLTMIATLMLAAGGGYYVFVLSKQTKVWLTRGRDMTGIEIPVARQTSGGLECKKAGGVDRRFIKIGHGYKFPFGSRYIGIEGTAYTGGPVVEMPDNTKDPINYFEDGTPIFPMKPISSTIPFSEAVELALGKELYAKVPAPVKLKIAETRWGLTVEAAESSISTKLPPLSEDLIHQGEVQDILKQIAQEEKKADMTAQKDMLLIGALGFLLCYLLVNAHVIPVA